MTTKTNEIFSKTITPYVDERGTITPLIEGIDFKSVLLIESKKGAIRANHWHKKDYHYCFLIKGEMNYYERAVGSNEKPQKLQVKTGDLFYTAPRREHCMEFTKDSIFFCFSKLNREQTNYENDTVRSAVDLSKI